MRAPQVIVRPAVTADHNFVYATYLRNRWFSDSNTTTLRKDTWMKLQHQRLEKIMATQRVLVACLSVDPDVILGYRLDDGSEPFTYIKRAFRQEDFQIQKQLDDAASTAQERT